MKGVLVALIHCMRPSGSKDGPKPEDQSNRMDMEPLPATIQGIRLSVWRREQETIWIWIIRKINSENVLNNSTFHLGCQANLHNYRNYATGLKQGGCGCGAAACWFDSCPEVITCRVSLDKHPPPTPCRTSGIYVKLP